MFYRITKVAVASRTHLSERRESKRKYLSRNPSLNILNMNHNITEAHIVLQKRIPKSYEIHKNKCFIIKCICLSFHLYI